VAGSRLASPDGSELEYLVTGSGEPVTVFAHGFGGGISETRPLGSGVAGRRTFFHFRGHGRSRAPAGPWTYQDLAADLRTVADATGASRALGVSLGAGALCRAVGDDPGRFTKIVLFLPAVLDKPRTAATRHRFAALLSAVGAGDAAGIAAVVRDEIPEASRDTASAHAYVRRRTDQLLRDRLAPSLASITDDVAVTDRGALRNVTATALVVGCRGDDLHPSSVAEEVAAALPHASLHIYDRPGIVWTERSDLRDRIAGFLNAPV
jgi:pimeloyl-ACP methyl ester carboxylesterase